MNENNEISYIFKAFRALYFYIKVSKTVIYIKIILYFSL